MELNGFTRETTQFSPKADRVTQTIHALDPLIQHAVLGLAHLAEITSSHHRREVTFRQAALRPVPPTEESGLVCTWPVPGKGA